MSSEVYDWSSAIKSKQQASLHRLLYAD